MRELHWICNECGLSIADDDGTVWVRLDRTTSLLIARKEWADRNNVGSWRPIAGAALLTYPPVEPWRAHHFACNPNEDSTEPGSYDIGVERFRTLRHALKWTAHLMGKQMLEVTDWEDLLSSIARDSLPYTITNDEAEKSYQWHRENPPSDEVVEDLRELMNRELETTGVVKLLVPKPDEVEQLTPEERANWASVVKDEVATQIDMYMKVQN